MRRVLFFSLALLFSSASFGIDPDLLHGLKARNIGPAAVGGRIAAIDAVRSNPNQLLIGTATGGAWQSENGGLNWTPVFDDQAVASVGAVAIHPLNPSIRWIGTGEGNVRNSTSIGGGMWKSVNGGKDWDFVGLGGTERINRIALHPTDTNLIYAAAMGTLWGDNTERGVYRSKDGGKSWERILYVDERTGATDIKIDPHNPDKLYAAMWEHRRWPWFFKSGGPGSGLYISLDGGETWEQKTEEDGLPKGELGRMVVAPSPAKPGRVYVLVEAKKSALIRSEDGGATFTKVNESHDIAPRPFYYTDIYTDPNDENRVYNLFTYVNVSIDGGKTFEKNKGVDCCAAANVIHVDNHAFWINPEDSNHLILGNDGGIAISRDKGETWRFVRNLPLAQFYHVSVDNADPYNVYGGLQDNGTWMGPAEIRQSAGIRNLHWQEIGFGDGFDALADPEIPGTGYSMSQGGNLNRWNLNTGEMRRIRPDGEDLRFNWNSALAQDPFAAGTIYYGSQYVHQSDDRGLSWRIISPDLTSNDPERQTYKTTGGITPDVTAAENHTSIVSIAPSKLDKGLIWVGTDDGRVHVTRNGGESWQRIDTKSRRVPQGAWVPMIEPSPHDASVAFVVIEDHRRSDMKPYVYRVSDYGNKWTSIVTDDLSGYALSIKQDPVDPNLLFVGTEFGLWFSTNGGGDWTKFTAGVPTVSVMDIAIQERESDLVLGTHGRSIFVIDDYSGLRGLGENAFSERLTLLSTTDGQQYKAKSQASSRFTGSGEHRAPNEPYGVMLTFMASGDDLPHPDDDADRQRRIDQRAAKAANKEDDLDTDKKNDDPKVELKVYTKAGELVRTKKFKVRQGINRIVWNLNRDGVRPAPSPTAKSIKDGLPDGPHMPQGEYRLTLTLGDDEISTTAKILPDQNDNVSPEAQQAQYAARMEMLALDEQAISAIEEIVWAKQDIDTALAIVSRGENKNKDLEKQGKALKKSLTEAEKWFRTPPKTKGIIYRDDKLLAIIGRADGMIFSSFDKPSPAAMAYAEQAKEATKIAMDNWNALKSGELASFREAASKAGADLFQNPRQSAALSDKETEVVQLIGQGFSNKEIARELAIEVSAVNNHVHSILNKYRVNRREQAAAVYRKRSSMSEG